MVVLRTIKQLSSALENLYLYIMVRLLMESYTVSYCDHTSILIVNSLGRIRRLYTPFRVTCKADGLGLRKGTSVYIEEVATTPQDELLFITSAGIYSHSCFTIVASF